MLGTKEIVPASDGLLPKGPTIWVDPDYLGRLGDTKQARLTTGDPGTVWSPSLLLEASFVLLSSARARSLRSLSLLLNAHARLEAAATITD